MSDPVKPAAPAAPANPSPAPASVADVPDVASDMQGQTYSFEESIEKAIADANKPADPSPAPVDPAKPADPAAPVDPAKPADPENKDSIEGLSDEAPEDWTPKAAAAFKKNKAEIKTLNATLTGNADTIRTLEARNKELEAQIGDSTRETLENRVKEFEQKQMLNDLENSEPYVKAITEPLDSIAEQANVIAERYGVNSDALIAAMANPDESVQQEKISELLVDASDRDKARVYNLIDQVPAILAQRKELRDNVDAATKEAALLKDQQEQQRLADALETRTNVTRNVAGRLTQKLPFLSDIEGVDLAALQEKASKIDIAAANPVEQAYANLSSSLFPSIIQELVRSRKENEVLVGKLAEFDGADPTITPKTTATPPAKAGAAAPASDGSSFADAVEQSLAGS